MVANSECPILHYLRSDEDEQPANNPVKTFEESGDNDLCFQMNCVFWIFETFYKSDEFRIMKVIHTGNHPLAFKIVNKTTNNFFKLIVSNRNHTLRASRQSSEHNKVSVYDDFWSTYGGFILQNLGFNFVRYDYIGNEKYIPMFYNTYYLSTDLVAYIIRKAIKKRNYICINEIWLDMDEFSQESQITIHKVSSETTDYDISLLTFKALVTLYTDDNLIPEQLISQFDHNNIPFHFRVGDPYNADENGRFDVTDYIIKRDTDNVTIFVEKKVANTLGIPVWDKFIETILSV
jgi:hypothetical protein